MIKLIALQKVLKLEFFALAAMYLAIDATDRSSFEYDHPNLPDARYFRHFVTSCQFALAAIDSIDFADYFWDCYEFLFVEKSVSPSKAAKSINGVVKLSSRPKFSRIVFLATFRGTYVSHLFFVIR